MIKLKPQWVLRHLSGDRWFLTSEKNHQVAPPDYVNLLQRIVQGVTLDDLDDEEFDKLTYLVENGFITTDPDHHPDAPAWELSGANFHSVQQQLKHVTFKILDSTNNKVGESIRQALLGSGMAEVWPSPRITIVVTDSYRTLPDTTGVMLPVVCNRMRVSVGPLVFPWGQNIRDRVTTTESYLPHPGYTLPQAFDQLQRGWLSVAIIQFIATTRLRYVDHFVEYDMSAQEFKTWPAVYLR